LETELKSTNKIIDMKSEIFLQPELEELVIDADKKSEWEEKVKTLGLDGQLKLTKNSPKDSASPYTFMNEQMKLVFGTLCPTKATVEAYDKSAIPLDVLSHIALCKQEGYFAKLEIWYDNKSPDPVLVGHLATSYSSPLHIIARWGDEVVPYEQLVEKAIARYTNGFILAAKDTFNQCERAIKDADTIVKQLFAGQKNTWSINPSFNMQLQNTDVPF
jgi:hypothetical protein